MAANDISKNNERGLMRGGLFALLTLLFLAGSYGAWHSLFAFKPLMTLIYSGAAAAGVFGTWFLFRDERKRAGNS